MRDPWTLASARSLLCLAMALPFSGCLPKPYTAEGLAAQSQKNLAAQFDHDQQTLQRQMRSAENELDLEFPKLESQFAQAGAQADDPRHIQIEESIVTEKHRYATMQETADDALKWASSVEAPTSADVEQLTSARKEHDATHRSIRMNLSNMRSNIASLRAAVRRGR